MLWCPSTEAGFCSAIAALWIGQEEPPIRAGYAKCLRKNDL